MSKKPQMHIGIRNQVDNPGTLELHFLDVIEDTFDWWTWESVNIVEDVINRIKAANPTHIHLVIDSEGGDARKGIALYNYLKNHPASVSSEILGLCGSIATVLSMAADEGKAKIPRNSFYVIHEAWGMGWGRAGDLRAQADVIEKHTDTIVDIYNQRTGISSDELKALIKDGDYWMSGEEAVEKGFCDGFVENEVAEFTIAARINSLDSRYRNIPKELKALAGAIDNTDNNTLINSLMKFGEKINAFIDRLSGKKVENKTDDLGADLANLMKEPMAELGNNLQEEVKNEMDSREEKLKKDVLNKFEARLDALEKGEHETIKNLKLDNEKLRNEIAALAGGESGADDHKKDEQKPVGNWVTTG